MACISVPRIDCWDNLFYAARRPRTISTLGERSEGAFLWEPFPKLGHLHAIRAGRLSL
jgi:hypothetical protein